MGQGGFEGIQADSHGNIVIVEDSGGKAGTLYPNAKQPNSFVFRFIPKDRRDLKKGGKLQALQVASKAHAGPIVFNAADIDGDIASQDQKDLHTYGNVFHTQWVTVHDTDVDGTDGVQRQRGGQGSQGHSVQAAGEWPVPARHRLSRVLLRRDGGHHRQDRSERLSADLAPSSS